MRVRQGIAVAVAAFVLSFASVATALGHDPSVRTVVSGLDNPRGVDVGPAGSVFIAEAGSGGSGGFGTSGRIAVWWRGHLVTVVGKLPSAVSPEGDVTGPTNVAVSGLGRLVYAIGGGPQNVDKRFDTVRRWPFDRTLADIQAYRNAHPDTTDIDQPPNPTDSNAYGLTLVGGGVLVTDAAGNELDLIRNNGRVVTVAKFPNEVIPTSAVGDPSLPPALPAEAVPTSVAVGPDGYWYVGELKGFPFAPGTSRVWRIAPWARNVVCDPAATHGACTVYADGFTSITGLDFGPDGSLYVVEIVKNGVNGLFSGTDVTGALIRYKNGAMTDISDGQLTLPGDVAVTRGGAIYVTNKSVCSTAPGGPPPCAGGGELVRVSP